MISVTGKLSQAVLLRGRSSTGKESSAGSTEVSCAWTKAHLLLLPVHHQPFAFHPILLLQEGNGIRADRGLQGLLGACSVSTHPEVQRHTNK